MLSSVLVCGVYGPDRADSRRGRVGAWSAGDGARAADRGHDHHAPAQGPRCRRSARRKGHHAQVLCSRAYTPDVTPDITCPGPARTSPTFIQVKRMGPRAIPQEDHQSALSWSLPLLNGEYAWQQHCFCSSPATSSHRRITCHCSCSPTALNIPAPRRNLPAPRHNLIAAPRNQQCPRQGSLRQAIQPPVACQKGCFMGVIRFRLEERPCPRSLWAKRGASAGRPCLL